MARARNIKPGLYKNEDLAECSIWARYIFPGLWMLADREGRLEDRPKRIKGELLPFDSQDIDPLLNELQALGFLVRYRNSDGSFIQISKFLQHQYPHYSEKISTIKPPENSELTGIKQIKIPRTLPETSENTQVLKGVPQHPCLLNPESLYTSSLNPSSLNPESGVDPASPDSSNPPSQSLSVAEKKQRRQKNTNREPGKTVETWNAYVIAYRNRYGVEPTRNAKVSGMLSKFIDRVPLDEAPQIAAFFVHSNRSFYSQGKHPIDLLLRDAEAMRTEWLTQNQGTDTAAKQADRTQATHDVWAPLLAQALANETINGSHIPWWLSDESLLAKGAEHGIEPGDLETVANFRERVFAVAGRPEGA